MYVSINIYIYVCIHTSVLYSMAYTQCGTKLVNMKIEEFALLFYVFYSFFVLLLLLLNNRFVSNVNSKYFN